MAILSIKGLSKEYNTGLFSRRVHALKNLSLEVEEGEIFGFLGPNGAGKTTTIKILLRIIYPTAGTAFLLGRELGDAHPHQVGYMPENPYFYRFLTGVEFLTFHAQLAEMEWRQLSRRVDELLEMVGMEHARDLRVGNYSKGMVTRIGLAQAMLTNPPLILMDEPMSGLDPIGRREIREIIMRLRDQKKTIFFCSHILADVETICDRVAILNKGELVKTATVGELLQEVAHGQRLVLRDLPKDVAENVLRDAKVIKEAGGLLQAQFEDADAASAACREALDKGGKVVEFGPERGTLEDYFVREIGGRND